MDATPSSSSERNGQSTSPTLERQHSATADDPEAEAVASAVLADTSARFPPEEAQGSATAAGLMAALQPQVAERAAIEAVKAGNASPVDGAIGSGDSILQRNLEEQLSRGADATKSGAGRAKVRISAAKRQKEIAGDKQQKARNRWGKQRNAMVLGAALGDARREKERERKAQKGALWKSARERSKAGAIAAADLRRMRGEELQTDVRKFAAIMIQKEWRRMCVRLALDIRPGESLLLEATRLKVMSKLVEFEMERAMSPTDRRMVTKLTHQLMVLTRDPQYLHAAEHLINTPRDAVQRLLVVNWATESGVRPLHRAAEFKNQMLVRFLLGSGAVQNLRDGEGMTPLHYAVTPPFPACVAMKTGTRGGSIQRAVVPDHEEASISEKRHALEARIKEAEAHHTYQDQISKAYEHADDEHHAHDKIVALHEKIDDAHEQHDKMKATWELRELQAGRTLTGANAQEQSIGTGSFLGQNDMKALDRRAAGLTAYEEKPETPPEKGKGKGKLAPPAKGPGAVGGFPSALPPGKGGKLDQPIMGLPMPVSGFDPQTGLPQPLDFDPVRDSIAEDPEAEDGDQTPQRHFDESGEQSGVVERTLVGDELLAQPDSDGEDVPSSRRGTPEGKEDAADGDVEDDGAGAGVGGSSGFNAAGMMGMLKVKNKFRGKKGNVLAVDTGDQEADEVLETPSGSPEGRSSRGSTGTSTPEKGASPFGFGGLSAKKLKSPLLRRSSSGKLTPEKGSRGSSRGSSRRSSPGSDGLPDGYPTSSEEGGSREPTPDGSAAPGFNAGAMMGVLKAKRSLKKLLTEEEKEEMAEGLLEQLKQVRRIAEATIPDLPVADPDASPPVPAPPKSAVKQTKKLKAAAAAEAEKRFRAQLDELETNELGKLERRERMRIQREKELAAEAEKLANLGKKKKRAMEEQVALKKSYIKLAADTILWEAQLEENEEYAARVKDLTKATMKTIMAMDHDDLHGHKFFEGTNVIGHKKAVDAAMAILNEKREILQAAMDQPLPDTVGAQKRHSADIRREQKEADAAHAVWALAMDGAKEEQRQLVQKQLHSEVDVAWMAMQRLLQDHQEHFGVDMHLHIAQHDLDMWKTKLAEQQEQIRLAESEQADDQVKVDQDLDKEIDDDAAAEVVVEEVKELTDEEKEHEIHAAFAMFDTDGGGSIDAGEFWELAEHMGMTMTKAGAVAAIMEIDNDQSGKIEREEFTKWWLTAAGALKSKLKTGEREIHEAFDMVDDDGTNSIDAGELKELVEHLGAKMTKSQSENVLDLIDTDNSGVVDRDEFTHWWRRSKSSLRALIGRGVVIEEMRIECDIMRENIIRLRQEIRDASEAIMERDLVRGCEATMTDVVNRGAVFSVPDERGFTACHLAAFEAMEYYNDSYYGRGGEQAAAHAQCCIRCAFCLLKLGDTMETMDTKGDCILHTAARVGGFGGLKVAKWFIERGKDVNTRNHEGKSPFYVALECNNGEVAKLISESKADINIAQRDGSTAKQASKFLRRLTALLYSDNWPYSYLEYCKEEEGANLKQLEYLDQLLFGIDFKWGKNMPAEFVEEVNTLYPDFEAPIVIHDPEALGFCLYYDHVVTRLAADDGALRSTLELDLRFFFEPLHAASKDHADEMVDTWRLTWGGRMIGPPDVLKSEWIINGSIQPINALQGDNRAVHTLLSVSGGDVVISASDSATARVFDVHGRGCSMSMKGHDQRIRCMEVVPAANCVFTGSDDKTIRRWALDRNCVCLQVYRGHTGSVLSLDADSQNVWLVSGSADATIRVWHVRSGNCTACVKTTSSGPAFGLAAANTAMAHAVTGHQKRGHSDITKKGGIPNKIVLDEEHSCCYAGLDSGEIQLWDLVALVQPWDRDRVRARKPKLNFPLGVNMKESLGLNIHEIRDCVHLKKDRLVPADKIPFDTYLGIEGLNENVLLPGARYEYGLDIENIGPLGWLENLADLSVKNFVVKDQLEPHLVYAGCEPITANVRVAESDYGQVIYWSIDQLPIFSQMKLRIYVRVEPRGKVDQYGSGKPSGTVAKGRGKEILEMRMAPASSRSWDPAYPLKRYGDRLHVGFEGSRVGFVREVAYPPRRVPIPRILSGYNKTRDERLPKLLGYTGLPFVWLWELVVNIWGLLKFYLKCRCIKRVRQKWPHKVPVPRRETRKDTGYKGELDENIEYVRKKTYATEMTTALEGDGNFTAYAMGKLLHLINIKTGKQEELFHPISIRSLMVANDHVVTGYADGSIRIWQLTVSFDYESLDNIVVLLVDLFYVLCALVTLLVFANPLTWWVFRERTKCAWRELKASSRRKDRRRIYVDWLLRMIFYIFRGMLLLQHALLHFRHPHFDTLRAMEPQSRDKGELLALNALRVAFNAVDTDGGGTIDRNEFRFMLQSQDIWLTGMEFAQVVAIVDDDNSGDIDFDEFSGWAQSDHPIATKMRGRDLLSEHLTATWSARLKPEVDLIIRLAADANLRLSHLAGLASKSVRKRFVGSHFSHVVCIVGFRSCVYSACKDGVICEWVDWHHRPSRTWHTRNGTSCLAFYSVLRTQVYAFIGNDDGKVDVIELRHGQTVATFDGSSHGAVTNLTTTNAVSDGGRCAVMAGFENGSLFHMKLIPQRDASGGVVSGQMVIQVVSSFAGHQSSVEELHFRDALLISRSPDRLLMHNLGTKHLLAVFGDYDLGVLLRDETMRQPIASMCFAKEFVFMARGNCIEVHDIAKAMAEDYGVNSVNLPVRATGKKKKQAQKYIKDVNKNRPARMLKGHTGPITTVVSLDRVSGADAIFSASEDGTVREWASKVPFDCINVFDAKSGPVGDIKIFGNVMYAQYSNGACTAWRLSNEHLKKEKKKTKNALGTANRFGQKLMRLKQAKVVDEKLYTWDKSSGRSCDVAIDQPTPIVCMADCPLRPDNKGEFDNLLIIGMQNGDIHTLKAPDVNPHRLMRGAGTNLRWLCLEVIALLWNFVQMLALSICTDGLAYSERFANLRRALDPWIFRNRGYHSDSFNTSYRAAVVLVGLYCFLIASQIELNLVSAVRMKAKFCTREHVKQLWHIVGSVVWGLCWAGSTVLVIPAVRALASVFICEEHQLLPNCFEGTHLYLCVLSGSLLLMYIPLAARVSRGHGDPLRLAYKRWLDHMYDEWHDETSDFTHWFAVKNTGFLSLYTYLRALCALCHAILPSASFQTASMCLFSLIITVAFVLERPYKIATVNFVYGGVLLASTYTAFTSFTMAWFEDWQPDGMGYELSWWWAVFFWPSLLFPAVLLELREIGQAITAFLTKTFKPTGPLRALNYRYWRSRHRRKRALRKLRAAYGGKGRAVGGMSVINAMRSEAGMSTVAQSQEAHAATMELDGLLLGKESAKTKLDCDPYVVLKINGEVFKTTTVKASRDPQWGEQHFFAGVQADHKLTLEVFDDDIGKDDGIGTAEQALDELEICEELDVWLDLQGIDTGKVRLKLTMQEGQTLQCLVVEAEALHAEDANAKIKIDCDPYLTLTVDGVNGQRVEKKTRVVDGSLHPIWFETIFFENFELENRKLNFEAVLEIAMFDHDAVGQDDPLGELAVQLSRPFPVGEVGARPLGKEDAQDVWLTLENTWSGRVHLKLTHDPHQKQLIVYVVEADDLHPDDSGEKSVDCDPYVMCSVGNVVQRSRTLSGTQEPRWNQRMELLSYPQDAEHVRLEVWDHDTVGSDDPLGWAEVLMDELPLGDEVDIWLDLEEVETGRVHVKLWRHEVREGSPPHISCFLVEAEHLYVEPTMGEIRAQFASVVFTRIANFGGRVWALLASCFCCVAYARLAEKVRASEAWRAWKSSVVYRFFVAIFVWLGRLCSWLWEGAKVQLRVCAMPLRRYLIKRTVAGRKYEIAEAEEGLTDAQRGMRSFMHVS